MNSNFSNIRLSKLTTPIDYKGPAREVLAGAMRDLVRKGQLNKANAKVLLENARSNFDPCLKYCTLAYLREAALRHSAQKVYVINMGSSTPSKEVFRAMPEYIRSRIIWADEDKKIYRSISNLMRPISNELEPIWERIREKTEVSGSDIRHGHEHGLCVLKEFLYTLTVALKYKTEADLDLKLAYRAIKRIELQTRESESRALLARIEGILNCYQLETKIPGIRATSSISVEDLLDDAKVSSLSKYRFMFGIPGKFQVALIQVNRKLREILHEKRNRSRIAKVSEMGNIATVPFPIKVPVIEMGQDIAFSPPLISSHEHKPNWLKTVRWLPRTKPPSS